MRGTGAARNAVMWYRLASYFCCGKYCCVGLQSRWSSLSGPLFSGTQPRYAECSLCRVLVFGYNNVVGTECAARPPLSTKTLL